jgi:sulfur carrier protein
MLTLSVNGQPATVPAGSSIADLLRLLALDGKRIAVERNGEIVPRSAHPRTTLADNDRLEVVVAVGGG